MLVCFSGLVGCAALLIYPWPGVHDLCWYGQAFADQSHGNAKENKKKYNETTATTTTWFVHNPAIISAPPLSEGASSCAQWGDSGRGCRLIAKIASRCFNATRPWRSFAAIKMKAAKNGAAQWEEEREREGEREWERERETEARATARANILFNLKHYRKFSGNYARCSNATAAAWRQLETRSSQLATCNSQGATLNLQLATEPKYPHRIHILHCPQSQHMSKVASCLLQLQLMLMNCCCPPSLLPPVAPSSSSLLWRVASRLAYIFLNLPSSLFRFDQLDRPYLIAATCRHVVCLKDITIPDLCVCSGHKSSSAPAPSPTPIPSCLAQPLSMHKSTVATRVIESRQQAVRHTDRQ